MPTKPRDTSYFVDFSDCSDAQVASLLALVFNTIEERTTVTDRHAIPEKTDQAAMLAVIKARRLGEQLDPRLAPLLQGLYGGNTAEEPIAGYDLAGVSQAFRASLMSEMKLQIALSPNNTVSDGVATGKTHPPPPFQKRLGG